MYLRRLSWDFWTDVFDGSTPPNLLAFLRKDPGGVSVWLSAADIRDDLIVGVAASLRKIPVAGLHLAEPELSNLQGTGVQVLQSDDHAFPVPALTARHHDVMLTSDEDASHFVAAVRSAGPQAFDSVDLDARILRLYDVSRLERERCGSYARALLERERPMPMSGVAEQL